MRIRSRIISLLLLLGTVLSVSSCLGSLLEYEENANATLYGTEWSTEKQTEGLKFYKDNSVLHFSSSGGNKTGTFDYDSSSKYIDFEGLTIIMQYLSAEITGASLESDTSMKVYWHELGKSDSYYMMMYKRR